MSQSACRPRRWRALLCATLGLLCCLLLSPAATQAQGDEGEGWPPAGGEDNSPPAGQDDGPPPLPDLSHYKDQPEQHPTDVPNASMKAPAWPADSTFEFGIYDATNARIATAYYRIQQDESNGRKLYRLKYTGRNDSLSESSECLIDRATLLPLRSSRKLVNSDGTFFWDIAYSAMGITVRTKQGEGEAESHEFPVGADYYDYESLIWLIPQIEFHDEPMVRLNLFDSIGGLPATLFVSDNGDATASVLGKSFKAHMYSFNVNRTPYRYWTIEKDGRQIPLRIDIKDMSFINLVAAGISKPPKASGKGKGKGRH